MTRFRVRVLLRLRGTLEGDGEDERGSDQFELPWKPRRADCAADAVQASLRARGQFFCLIWGIFWGLMSQGSIG